MVKQVLEFDPKPCCPKCRGYEIVRRYSAETDHTVEQKVTREWLQCKCSVCGYQFEMATADAQKATAKKKA
jgi:hypothetical protein